MHGHASYTIPSACSVSADFSWVIRRVLNRVRPDLIVLVELEVWYNLLAIADRRGGFRCGREWAADGAELSAVRIARRVGAWDVPAAGVGRGAG